MVTKSDFAWPDTIEAAVAGVVFDRQGAVLLVRRTDNGLWGLPSGHIEKAETVSSAICREINEETGLVVIANKLIGVYSEPDSQIFCYPSGKTTHFITLSFLCRPAGGRLRPDRKEVSEAAFFQPSKLPRQLMTMHPQWLNDALAAREAAWVR
ncbi:MAG: NUDIX domain-containing protein [Sporomusaceae bacterium]|nr:NUDIX domain-containing protein [Sporomusaceae bacterium]